MNIFQKAKPKSINDLTLEELRKILHKNKNDSKIMYYVEGDGWNKLGATMPTYTMPMTVFPTYGSKRNIREYLALYIHCLVKGPENISKKGVQDLRKLDWITYQNSDSPIITEEGKQVKEHFPEEWVRAK